ncbi:MAG: nuclear transport factor 2 family protein [Microbacterium sp.]|nr:MAG: nuclear transport factor 2 family protein [Microbacterium sp.]
MTDEQHPATVDDRADAPIEVALAVQQLYGRHFRAIDRGDGTAWARTFTDDGEFHSPSYERPACGRDELTAFGDAFGTGAAARREVPRHVLTNLHVGEGDRPGHVVATGYLSIVVTDAAGVRTLRMTVITDDIVRGDDGIYRIARRRVAPDTVARQPTG